MARKILVAVLATALTIPGVAFARGHSDRSNHRSRSDRGKTEHVGSYTRKDGKTVKAYDRHPAGAAPTKAKKKK